MMKFQCLTEIAQKILNFEVFSFLQRIVTGQNFESYTALEGIKRLVEGVKLSKFSILKVVNGKIILQ